MLKKKKTETVEDIKKRKMTAELLDLRASSLNFKIPLEGVSVECTNSKTAKRLLIDVFGVKEAAGWECKGDCSNCFCFIVKTSTGEWEHILPVVDR